MSMHSERMKREQRESRRREILESLYQELRRYQDGRLAENCVAVGCLDTELSAVYLAVERTIRNPEVKVPL